MPDIPGNNLESALALARDGYTFISKRCRRYRSDVFQTRLMLVKTICMTGEESAKVFYDPRRFQREGAAPARLKKTLFGQGGVQGLDGDAHHCRKQMFMSLMAPERLQRLADLAADSWRDSLARWERMPSVVLFDEVQQIFCRAVCQWSGVPLAESEVEMRTSDFGRMIQGSGAVGPQHWAGRLARKRAERWIGEIIQRVRSRQLDAAEGTALNAVAWHRDPDGQLLDRHAAAVELINVLRPTVAVARFVVFAALAIVEHPEWLEKLREDGKGDAELFVQEVRRYFPFFPFVAALVREEFEWQGYRFPQGARVLLDLYGTNRDARIWEEPDAFRPDRFRKWNESAFNFIPQGGGDHDLGHRCAGEWITIELMKTAVGLLTRSMRYDVPEQDLRISLSTMPAFPKSRFVIRNVRRAQPES